MDLDYCFFPANSDKQVEVKKLGTIIIYLLYIVFFKQTQFEEIIQLWLSWWIGVIVLSF